MAKYEVVIPKPPTKTLVAKVVVTLYRNAGCEKISYSTPENILQFDVPDEFEWVYANKPGSMFSVHCEYTNIQATLKEVKQLVPRRL
jgi:hypothetical protein